MGLVHPSRCFPISKESSEGAGDMIEDSPSTMSADDFQPRMIVSVKEANLGEESFLGKGTFGRVSLVTQKCVWPGGDAFVSRKLALKRPTKDPEHETVSNERSVLMKIDHPNIIKLLGICEARTVEGRLSRCQMTEYCTNGELFQLIVAKGPLSEDMARDYFFQILKALNYMHKVAKLVHRDLKPENILLTNDMRLIKICDLGTAVRLSGSDNNRKAHGRIGSLSYAAPEVYIDSVADFSSDIWSAGVILYVMFCVASPFRNSQDADPEISAINRVKKGNFNKDRALWKSMPREPKNLIKRILKLTSQKRPSAAQLLNYNWFQKFRVDVTRTNMTQNEVIDSLVEFSEMEQADRDCWLAFANQLGQWDCGDCIFDMLDSNHDGIVDRLDLLRFKPGCQKDIERILYRQSWLPYSEVIAALAATANRGKGLDTIFPGTLPFAYDALARTGKYPDLTYNEFSDTLRSQKTDPSSGGMSTKGST